jgi:probable F420-dependent oxidoreductase
MPTLELGPVGAAIDVSQEGFTETAAALEQMGYSTIWITGGPMSSLDQVRAVVEATKTAIVATGILAAVRYPSDEAAALYAELERDHPGRFVLGLGGAHGPDPMGTLRAYLDRLDATVPASRRVLATLGPAMQRLARDRAAGALPVLVTPEQTARMRETLGPDCALAVEQFVVVESDPARARALAHGPLDLLGQAPAYQANFRRMGFAGDDVTQRSDRLVDGLIAWGEPGAIAERLRAHQRAGADQVVVNVIAAGPGPALDDWQAVIDAVAP